MPREARAPVERKGIRPDEFAKVIGVSRAYGYQIVRKGLVRSVRCGRAVIIPLSAVDEFLAGDGARG